MALLLTNKELKKWRKIQFKLKRSGVSVTDEVTSYIALANGGLGNGVNVKQLHELLKPCGVIKTLISTCEKSYALIAFDSEKSASNCFEKCQGYELLKEAEKIKSVLFAYFVKSLPNHLEASCIDNCKNLPHGLYQYEEFVSPEEELKLMQHIEADIAALSAQCIQEDLKQRTVVHYGYRFCYGTNNVDCSQPLCGDGLPDFSKPVITKLMEEGHFTKEPDQLTINRYNPGDGIPPHVDNPIAFDDTLATLSLGSAIVMEMKSQSGMKTSFLLKPRSLLVLTKDARYLWTHGIQARKTDVVHNGGNVSAMPCIVKRQTRLSMTFRKVITATNMSSTATNSLAQPSCKLPLDQKEAVQFEKELVHNVYSNIAQHFSCTREKPWPRVVDFLNSLEPGATVLDVGCGSGRYLNVNRSIFALGCDYCSSLANICLEKQSNVFVCDGLDIPIRSNSFDASICIAVIHHYSTFERQVTAIKELLRVVSTGGLCLIYVWAAEQKYNNANSSYLKQNLSKSYSTATKVDDVKSQSLSDENRSRSLVVHKNRTEFAQQDVLVPWKTKSNVSKSLQKRFGENANHTDSTYYRFYHVFKQSELEKLCSSIPNCSIVNSYYDNGNWSVILKKS